MADAAEQDIEFDVLGEGVATLEGQGSEGGRFDEGGEGFGLGQGEGPLGVGERDVSMKSLPVTRPRPHYPAR